jgi:hypothetical protein
LYYILANVELGKYYSKSKPADAVGYYKEVLSHSFIWEDPVKVTQFGKAFNTATACGIEIRLSFCL